MIIAVGLGRASCARSPTPLFVPEACLEVQVKESVVKHTVTVVRIQRWLQGACSAVSISDPPAFYMTPGHATRRLNDAALYSSLPAHARSEDKARIAVELVVPRYRRHRERSNTARIITGVRLDHPPENLWKTRSLIAAFGRSTSEPRTVRRWAVSYEGLPL